MDSYGELQHLDLDGDGDEASSGLGGRAMGLENTGKWSEAESDMAHGAGPAIGFPSNVTVSLVLILLSHVFTGQNFDSYFV